MRHGKLIKILSGTLIFVVLGLVLTVVTVAAICCVV